MLQSIPVFFLLFVLATGCRDNKGFVVGKIKKASKLSTTEFTMDKIVFGVKNRKLFWLVKISESQFVAYSKAVIKAGIDLEKLQQEDVKIEGKKIALLLPAVEIINFSYPAEKFERDSLISNNTLLSKVSIADQESFFQDAETDIRNNLQYLGIVSLTEKKTAKMLDTMLRTLGYEEIYIDFKKSDTLIFEITPEE